MAAAGAGAAADVGGGAGDAGGAGGADAADAAGGGVGAAAADAGGGGAGGVGLAPLGDTGWRERRSHASARASTMRSPSNRPAKSICRRGDAVSTADVAVAICCSSRMLRAVAMSCV